MVIWIKINPFMGFIFFLVYWKNFRLIYLKENI
nr:MAG TPA: hypothetical protein [Caudoviricetes sp.]